VPRAVCRIKNRLTTPPRGGDNSPALSWNISLRALVAFLVRPGVIAILVPLAWLVSAGRTRLEHPLGLVLLALGFAGLLRCVRDFYVAGKGTLAP
jgi:hypothetical protein